jgi:hypothetical protein
MIANGGDCPPMRGARATQSNASPGRGWWLVDWGDASWWNAPRCTVTIQGLVMHQRAP